MIAHEVDDAPAPVALLEVRESERGNFGSSKAAAEKHREDGAIAQAAHRCDIGRIEKALGLAYGEPVTRGVSLPATDTLRPRRFLFCFGFMKNASVPYSSHSPRAGQIGLPAPEPWKPPIAW
jgi:hypothetical protein